MCIWYIRTYYKQAISGWETFHFKPMNNKLLTILLIISTVVSVGNWPLIIILPSYWVVKLVIIIKSNHNAALKTRTNETQKPHNHAPWNTSRQFIFGYCVKRKGNDLTGGRSRKRLDLDLGQTMLCLNICVIVFQNCWRQVEHSYF